MPTHPIPPLYSRDPSCPPRVLILGSFPSVKSRETAFFYGHPQNRFWKVMAAVLYPLDAPAPGGITSDLTAPDLQVPVTVEEKTHLLLSHGIALWDVIASCDIQGSSDSSITNVVPTDLTPLLAGGTVRAIFTNGATATKLYRKHQESLTGRPSIQLPSTSPANAAKHLNQLIEAWSVIRDYL